VEESAEMEDLRAISLRQGIASTGALMRPEQQLAPAQKLQIGELLANMVAAYPHQDMAESMPMYQRGWERLAVEFGTGPLEQALEFMLTLQKFFPHPSEVREVLDEMAKKEQAKVQAQLPRIGCDICKDQDGLTGLIGFVLVDRPGRGRAVEPCECRKRRELAKKAMEAKS
jgi:hypothetical protein